jgi:hypothetical protein
VGGDRCLADLNTRGHGISIRQFGRTGNQRSFVVPLPYRAKGFAVNAGSLALKGLVFTTFFDFCEERFGSDMLEDVIDDACLPHGGAFTSVGTYPFGEMVALITALVKRTGTTMPQVLERFGAYCFGCWVRKFPALFDGRDLFDVLADIDNFHETEVRKLYPDAELPSFKVVSRTADYLQLDYHSCKPLADLAVGVIQGAGAYLNSPVSVTFRAAGDRVRFRVDRVQTRRLAA